ncbi:MAG: methionyl-tRNA formyltransferase [Lachnospiraceae bacterium]|nr:methionyl-tRNA formyltransferase [Lachnospiraceae bacterium]
MRVVFMGTPDFAVGTLDKLVEEGHQVVGVVTQPDKPRGRGKAMQPTPVKEAALRHGLEVYQPERVREEEFQTVLRELAPEVIVVVAFGQIIPESILQLPPYGCLNVHASLLPKYRGAAPIQWAVIDGEKTAGVTIMQMDAGLDTGDMLSFAEIPLAADETGGSLFDKLSDLGAQLLADTLPKVEAGGIQPVPQPADSPTDYARMITKEDGRIDWSRPAEELERRIRGVIPWPGAFSRLNGKTLKVWKAEILNEDSSMEPGQIVAAGRDGLTVQTGSGQIRITDLQMEGKKRMPADAFLRGYQIEPGTRLGE